MNTLKRHIYECEYCKMKFNDKKSCMNHERDYHKCPKCKHFWLLYGYERTCDLNYECQYEPKSK